MAEVEEGIWITGERGRGTEGSIWQQPLGLETLSLVHQGRDVLFCMGGVSGSWKSHGAIVWLCRSFNSSNQVSRGGVE